MNNIKPTAIEIMPDWERKLYERWLKAVLADDTNPAYREIVSQGEAAVWEVVDVFGVNYMDVTRSWLVAAGESITNEGN
jgi:hypothetical protein